MNVYYLDIASKYLSSDDLVTIWCNGTRVLNQMRFGTAQQIVKDARDRNLFRGTITFRKV